MNKAFKTEEWFQQKHWEGEYKGSLSSWMFLENDDKKYKGI